MQQHAVIVVGLVLPVDAAAQAAVALAIALGDVEEGLFRTRIGAGIGEGGGLHGDQRGQFLTLGAGQRQRRRQRGHSHGLGAPIARRLRRQRDLALDLRQAFVGSRETVGELQLRKTIFEHIDRRSAGRSSGLGIPGFCVIRVRRQHAGARRLAALNQDEGERHAQRGHRDPMPSLQGAARHRPGLCPAGAIICQEFRNCSDHPPRCPKRSEINLRSTVYRRKLARV